MRFWLNIVLVKCMRMDVTPYIFRGDIYILYTYIETYYIYVCECVHVFRERCERIHIILMIVIPLKRELEVSKALDELQELCFISFFCFFFFTE